MTEDDITTEMSAIQTTLRALKVRRGGKRPTEAHHMEARLLQEKHAELAKKLQVYQIAELNTAIERAPRKLS